ncbi:MAG: fibronectin type III domain-containing protein [Solirubrobacterales bacterium]
MTKRLHAPGIALLGAFLLVVGIAAVARSSSNPPAQAAKKTIQLEDATMIVEVNDTDGDAGLQVFLDGEPWRSMKVSMPGGPKILDVDAKGRLKNFGLTELFSETNEPEFKDLPLSKFKKRFPEGRYTFAGRTIEGMRLVGKARLSHDIPAGPEITAPAAGSTVPHGDVVASWAPVSRSGIEIAGYRAIVEREDPLRVFNADLPASQTSVTIPSEFLEPGTEYKLEVQSIEKSGNQTISEIAFRVD